MKEGVNMEYILGEILLFPFQFEMQGFISCQGQTLPVAQNQALFSLIGYTYGGDGRTTFALPNLKGAEPLPGMRYYIVTSGIYPERQ
jgi:microcystin-dependent protein